MDIFFAASAIPAHEVARQEGISLEQRGGRFWARCVLHGEKTPSLCFFADGGWKCFGCGAGGRDGTSFYAALHGVGQAEAARRIVAGLGGRQGARPAAEALLRDLNAWRRVEAARLRELRCTAQARLDGVVAGAASWDAAWDAPGFVELLNARETARRLEDELIGATLAELYGLKQGVNAA